MIKISVITAVHNSKSTIQDCLESVQSQDYPNIEHIVIDGKSSDGTLDILKQYRKDISILISEKDLGIYDALNKGLKYVTGDIVGFLHSDDIYANSNVLSLYAEAFEGENIDSCYGDLIYVESGNTKKSVRYWKSGPLKRYKLRWGWMPPHPTLYIRNELYQKLGGFRLDMGTAGDYESIIRFFLKHKISAKYIPSTMIKMRVGGASNVTLRNRIRANMNDRKAWKVNKVRPYPWALIFKPLSKIKQYI